MVEQRKKVLNFIRYLLHCLLPVILLSLCFSCARTDLGKLIEENEPKEDTGKNGKWNVGKWNRMQWK